METSILRINKPEIKVVTLATEEKGYFKWLKQSCERNGVNLTVLGMGMEWRGYMMKCELLKDMLENEDDNNIICVVDAYDVLMLKDVNSLRDDFIKFVSDNNCSIICTHDPVTDTGIKFFDMITTEIKCRHFNCSRTSGINAGAYIGYVRSVKVLVNEMIRRCRELGEVDDQKILNELYNSGTSDIKIDMNKDFFKLTPFEDIIDRDDYIF